MCKGISIVTTKNECYWASDNSHETIKKENNLRDDNVIADGLLIIELIPRGKKFLSEQITDWEFITENETSWYRDNKNETEEQIYNYLFNVVFTSIKQNGLKKLDLSNLNYTKLPGLENIKIGSVNCYNNELTELNLPLMTGDVHCSNNSKTFTQLDWKNYRG